jgi:hypothetical protein
MNCSNGSSKTAIGIIIIIMKISTNRFLVSLQKKCATTDDSTHGCESRVPHNMCPGRETLAENKVRARRIDELSRFCFPLIFAVFNLCYWSYYLS